MIVLNLIARKLEVMCTEVSAEEVLNNTCLRTPLCFISSCFGAMRMRYYSMQKEQQRCEENRRLCGEHHTQR